MVLCSKCSKEIKSKNDLIVASYFLIPKPYHRKCHSDILLKDFYPPLFNVAINVSWARTVTGLAIVLVLFIAYNIVLANEGVLQEPVIMAFNVLIFLFVLVLPLVERIYSHYFFEKKLK